MQSPNEKQRQYAIFIPILEFFSDVAQKEIFYQNYPIKFVLITVKKAVKIDKT